MKLYDENIEDESLELEPILSINLDEINDNAKNMANLITKRLSNYYFDEKYIEKHPYIPTKVMTEMNNIRRLLKMLDINEKAQDSLITFITLEGANKGTLYMSLTSLQNSMINIQKQLNDLTTQLEDIFKEMQQDAEKNFIDKDKEEDENGMMTVRGSREFIRQLNEILEQKNQKIS